MATAEDTGPLGSAGLLAAAALAAHVVCAVGLLAMGTLPPLIALATGAAVDVALAGGLAALARAVGLPLWIALLAWLALQWADPAVAGFALLVCGAALGLSRGAFAARPLEWVLAAGIAVGAARRLWPALARRQILPLPDSIWLEPVVTALGLLVLGLALVLVTRTIGRRGGIPGALVLALGLEYAIVSAAFAGLAPLPRYAPGDATEEDRPHVFLIVLDTVAAGHLSMYGYERDTTPALAALVREHPRAVLFPSAFANGSWTLPSHGSLFTGLLPRDHGLHKYSHLHGGAKLGATATLAERARKSGYRTGSIFANRFLDLAEGLERGFDWWIKPEARRPVTLFGGRVARSWILPSFGVAPTRPYAPAEQINAQVLRFVDHCLPGPCLVFVNYLDAHAPYLPDPARRGTFGSEVEPYGVGETARFDDPPEVIEYLRARYDEEILGLDAKLRDLLDALEARGVLDRSWLVITSDHGEGFEAGRPTEHGGSLYDPQVRVPLIVVPPRGERLAPSAAAVSLVDVASTLGAIVSGKVLGRGHDLREPVPDDRLVSLQFFGDFRERAAATCGPTLCRPAQATIAGDLKLIVRGAEFEVYDLARDPAERSDLSRSLDPPTVGKLLSGIGPALVPDRGDSPGKAPALSRDARDELRALGYLD